MDDYKNQLRRKRKSQIGFKTRSSNFARRIIESSDYQRANIQPSKEGNITGHEIQSESTIAYLCTTAIQAAINNKQLALFYMIQGKIYYHERKEIAYAIKI